MRVAVHSLSKAFGLLWALRDADLELNSGDCVALLGPNGAGKTTLLKLLCGLLDPTAGSIEMEGVKLRGGSSALRSTIGFLSPNEHFYEHLTAKENLRFFGALYGKGENTSDIAQALQTVGLARWSDDYVGSLSSGMKCRLAIAKWLLLEPKLLLLDEPYGVLDGSGVDLLESFVQKLRRSGAVVVIASHHVSRVLALCSRALILHHGKLIFDEAKQEPWLNFQRAFGEFLPRGEKWNS